MLFIPRQVALVSRAAAAGSMANDEPKKEKKSKSNKAKGSASAATAHVVGSIAAFLKSHGFPRTLAALQSEANLEGNGWELSSVSLEDLFSRFLDSSHGPTGVRVDGNTKQDPSTEKTSEETHKKKKKKGGAEVSETEKVKGLSSLQKPSKDDHTTLVLQDETKKKKEKRGGVEVLETESKACEQSTMEKPGENGDGTTAPHDETKESKRKKKSSSLAVKADDGQTNERGKNNDQEVQLQNPDDGHKKKGKKQKLDDDVEARLEQVELAIKNKYDAAENLEEDRKKKSVEDPENCKESESQNDTAGKNGLGNNAPQDKGKKKKKGKSTSEKLSSETSNKMDAGTAPDEVGGNSDGTKEKADIVETEKSGNEKKSKKKRKKSNSEENVMGEDEEIAGKDLVARPNDENKGRMEISNTENSRPESENTVVGKKRKLEEVEGSTPPIKGDLSVCDQNNQKLSNGFAGDDAKEKSTVSKPSKRQKHSSEPKTVNTFQRVKLEDVKFADERLQDNSYWAKGGADSGYGAKAQEVLGQVRGRDFRHEKTKKKRGSYRGGQIDLQTHSIKFNYSDDE